MKPRLQISFSVRDTLRFLFGKPYTPNPNQFLLNHARTGIYVALKSLNLPQGAKVAVMAYNCNSVMAAVVKARCNIVFVDVTKDLRLNLEDLARKIEGVSVLVVTHLYGIVNDVDAIKMLYPHLTVIEDCAHAWGSELNGRACGANGDFSVFSVGQAKLPSIGDGGILQVNDLKYLQSVSEYVAKLPKYSVMKEFTLLARLQASAFLLLPTIYSLWHSFKPQKVKLGGFVPLQMADGISKLLSSKQKETQCLIQSRQANCRVLLEKLKANVSPIVGDEGWNCFMLPIWCESPASVIEEYAHKGVEVAAHFTNAIVWARKYGYLDGSCPVSETIVNHVITFPTYYIV